MRVTIVNHLNSKHVSNMTYVICRYINTYTSYLCVFCYLQFGILEVVKP